MGKKSKRSKTKAGKRPADPSSEETTLSHSLEQLSLKRSDDDENKCHHGRPYNLRFAKIASENGGRESAATSDGAAPFMYHFEMSMDTLGVLSSQGIIQKLRGSSPITREGGGPHPFDLFGHAKNMLKTDGQDHMWDNDETKDTLSACLLSLGTEYLISHHHELQRGQKSFYDDMAAAVLVAHFKLNEGIDPIDGMSPNQIPIMRDFMGAGVSKWVKFFEKRVPCRCLRDKALQQNLVRKGPTVGVCHGCIFQGQMDSRDKNRRDLLICSACKVCQYCSKECQRRDWPRHKRECAYYAANPNTKVSESDMMARSLQNSTFENMVNEME